MMAQAPETLGRVYGCTHCDDAGLMTIGESFRHSEAMHPETIRTLPRTPETEANYARGLAEVAKLRAALGLGKS